MKEVTIEEVRKRAAEVRLYDRDDPETAHKLQDSLYEDVLFTVALVPVRPDVMLMAIECIALTTLPGSRWYA